MFKSGLPNPYDEIVTKTTDENLTSEDWELILNLCDKVQDEGPTGAHNVIAAVLKRLAHRNPTVQLYALSLAEALSKNCNIELHREIASKAFTQGLEKIITDRTTHEKVKRRALSLVAMWTAEFENDSTLGVMEDCYNNLKSKGYKFEVPQEAPPPSVDDEVRRREEEELQRVLELSVQDRGGRSQWQGYLTTAGASSSGAGASGSGSTSSANLAGASGSGSSSNPPAAVPQPKASSPPTYHAGYVPARTPSPRARAASPTTPPASNAAASAAIAPVAPDIPTSPAPSSATTTAMGPAVTRVRAIHTFEPTEAGELAFDRGDVIKVVDRGYKDWWRGQLKGRTGIFPVNYVEPMPEPTSAELAKEAEQEAAVFAQAANVDRLLTMLRSLDPAQDNLADNEEIQELYRSSMTLRPKIVKLIEKYSQKRADLVSMNETFVRAKTIFDRMMEESLARHTGVYESRTSYGPQPSGPQPYGWNPSVYDASGYNVFPPALPYAQGPDGVYQAAAQQSYADPNAYQYAQYPVQPSVPHGTYGLPAAGATAYPTPSGQQPSPGAQPDSSSAHPQQHSPPATQSQNQPQAQPIQQQPQAGPPFVFDPNGTYADPNVQAWATYYAQGGTDLAGSVYFTFIPGLTDGTAQPAIPQGAQNAQQPQSQTSQPQSSVPVEDSAAAPLAQGQPPVSGEVPGQDSSKPLPLQSQQEPANPAATGTQPGQQAPNYATLPSSTGAGNPAQPYNGPAAPIPATSYTGHPYGVSDASAIPSAAQTQQYSQQPPSVGAQAQSQNPPPQHDDPNKHTAYPQQYALPQQLASLEGSQNPHDGQLARQPLQGVAPA